MVLPSLPDGFLSGGCVFRLVFLCEFSGGTVDDDVRGFDHVLNGTCDGHACCLECLQALLGNVHGVALLDCVLSLVGRTSLGDSNDLHIVLLVDCGCDPFTDCSVSVDSYLDLHQAHLYRRRMGGHYN